MQLFYEIDSCLFYEGMIFIGMYFFEGESDDFDSFEIIGIEFFFSRGQNLMDERKIPLS